MTKKGLKLFIVKKYIMANSASDAIRKEKTIKPDDVWVDDDWKKGQETRLESAIGFQIDDDE